MLGFGRNYGALARQTGFWQEARGQEKWSHGAEDTGFLREARVPAGDASSDRRYGVQAGGMGLDSRHGVMRENTGFRQDVQGSGMRHGLWQDTWGNDRRDGVQTVFTILCGIQAGVAGFRQEVRVSGSMYEIQTGHARQESRGSGGRHGIRTECTGFRQAGGKGFRQYVRDSDRTRGLQRYERRDSGRRYGV